MCIASFVCVCLRYWGLNPGSWRLTTELHLLPTLHHLSLTELEWIVLTLPPFDRWREGGLEKCGYMPNFTWPVNGHAGMWTQDYGQNLVFIIVPCCSRLGSPVPQIFMKLFSRTQVGTLKSQSDPCLKAHRTSLGCWSQPFSLWPPSLIGSTADVTVGSLEKHMGHAVGLPAVYIKLVWPCPWDAQSPSQLLREISARTPFLAIICTHSKRQTAHFNSQRS